MRLLMLLIAVHVMAGLWLTWEVWSRTGLIAPALFHLLWMGTVLGQAGLIGLWAGVSPTRRTTWWLGVICGALVLWAEGLMAFREWAARAVILSLILVLAPLCFSAALTAIMCRRGMRLAQAHEISATSATEAIQFSLKQLLLLISAMAIALSAARALHALSLLGLGVTLACAVLLVVVFGVIFAGQTLTSLWATLGLARWYWRLPAPLLLAALGGALMGYADGGSRVHYEAWIPTTVLQAAIVIATLIVIRRLGFRLVLDPRHSSPRHDQRELLEGSVSVSDFAR